MSPPEVDALTTALRTHRDRAMVAAMVLGGLRRCEPLGLRLEDLRFGEQRAFGHIEAFKPWLAARPGQKKPAVATATISASGRG